MHINAVSAQDSALIIDKALINEELVDKILIDKALINKALVNESLTNKEQINQSAIAEVVAVNDLSQITSDTHIVEILPPSKRLLNNTDLKNKAQPPNSAAHQPSVQSATANVLIEKNNTSIAPIPLLTPIFIPNAKQKVAAPAPKKERVAGKSAKIVILIDDMGNSLKLNNAALNLPGAISFAFLPHAHFSKRLAKEAKNSSKDVLLHAPMENIHNYPLGKGGMTSKMSEVEFKAVLNNNIDAVPDLIGVNNHMGSKLTSLPLQMRWTMEVVKARGLFFLDSKTTGKSVAWDQAKIAGIAGLKRDIFLDHDRNLPAMKKQFNKAIAMAKKSGYSVVIAHPYAITIKFLNKELKQLAKRNVELVSISALIAQIKSNSQMVAATTLSADLLSNETSVDKKKQ